MEVSCLGFWSLKCWPTQSSCIQSKGLRLWSGVNVTLQAERIEGERGAEGQWKKQPDSSREKTPLLPRHRDRELRGKKMVEPLEKRRVSLHKRAYYDIKTSVSQLTRTEGRWDGSEGEHACCHVRRSQLHHSMPLWWKQRTNTRLLFSDFTYILWHIWPTQTYTLREMLN